MSLDEPTRWIESDTGGYIVEPNVLIWAPGMGRVFLPSRVAAEETPITLPPEGRIEIKATDSEGRPFAGLAVVDPADFSYHASRDFEVAPATDANGLLVLSNLSPGTYAHRVVQPQAISEDPRQWFEEALYPLILVSHVVPGEVCRHEIVFPSPDGDTAEAWLAKGMMGERVRPRLNGEPFPELPDRCRERVGVLVSEGLDALCGAVRWEEDQAASLAYLVLDWRLESAVPAIRALLGRWALPSRSDIWADRGSPALSLALATLEGDHAVDDFARWAADPARPYAIRRDAVMALGQIGTEASLEAYRRLCDTARKRPGAPASVADPTPAQRMAEAVEMTFGLIPERPRWGMGPAPESAQVSEDGATGTIDCRTITGHQIVTLVSIAGDWMVNGLGSGGHWSLP